MDPPRGGKGVGQTRGRGVWDTLVEAFLLLRDFRFNLFPDLVALVRRLSDAIQVRGVSSPLLTPDVLLPDHTS